MANENTISHLGRIRIWGLIETVTGLHIGGTEVGIAIGGVDNTVIRNGLDGVPYIPGSSLKGKMRSLLERVYKGDKLFAIIKGKDDKQHIRIHMCEDTAAYEECFVCNIFGILPEKVRGSCMPTRLIVRDAVMDKPMADRLRASHYNDMPMTQVKTEVVLDRITSQATPRQIERVPAGVEFKYELVFNVYKESDLDYLQRVAEAMDFVEQDYIGGQGSRGYGQIRFATRHVEAKWFTKVPDCSGDVRYTKFASDLERNPEPKAETAQ